MIPESVGFARDLPSSTGILVLSAIVLLSGDPITVVIAIPLLVASMFATPLVAFLLGQLSLLPVIEPVATVPLVVAQCGLFVILTEPARDAAAWRLLAATGVWLLGLTGVLVITIPWGLPYVAALLVTIVATGVYLFHRLTLLGLGLVSPTATNGSNEGPPKPHRVEKHDDPDESALDQTSKPRETKQ